MYKLKRWNSANKDCSCKSHAKLFALYPAMLPSCIKIAINWTLSLCCRVFTVTVVQQRNAFLLLSSHSPKVGAIWSVHQEIEPLTHDWHMHGRLPGVRSVDINNKKIKTVHQTIISAMIQITPRNTQIVTCWLYHRKYLQAFHVIHIH